MMEQRQHKSIFDRALLRTRVRSANVKPVESLLGYLVGPFCAMLANGIFTTYLMRYFRDVLFAEELAAGSVLKGTIESFLMLFPILSAILIVAGNLIAGQLVERAFSRRCRDAKLPAASIKGAFGIYCLYGVQAGDRGGAGRGARHPLHRRGRAGRVL